MLKSIGAFVCVRSREVVRFWEGPLREAILYLYGYGNESFVGYFYIDMLLWALLEQADFNVASKMYILIIVVKYLVFIVRH